MYKRVMIILLVYIFIHILWIVNCEWLKIEREERKLKHFVFSSHSTFFRFSSETQTSETIWCIFRGFYVKQKQQQARSSFTWDFIFIIESTFVSFRFPFLLRFSTACNHKWNSQHSIKTLCWSFMMFIFPQIPYRVLCLF